MQESFQNLKGFPKRKENFILAELRAFRMRPLLLADKMMVNVEGDRYHLKSYLESQSFCRKITSKRHI